MVRGQEAEDGNGSEENLAERNRREPEAPLRLSSAGVTTPDTLR
jgi:hypothetical protein